MPKKTKGKIGDNQLNADELKEAIERLDNFDQQKKDLTADANEVKAMLRNRGYSNRVVSRLRKVMKQDPQTRQEDHLLLKLYADAIGVEIDPFS